ncbi:MAG: hypothetical protein HGA53_02715, partial [Anaerolineaceae bacterium]|nr:hypothetical protein [Anaerolineaceae bacterium]
MPQKSLNPLRSLFVSLAAFISGRLRFPRQRVGQQMVLDGETWVIFREAVMLPRPGQPEKPGAVFRPRFHVRGMSVQQNIRFSLLPMGFFLGLPGFRSKLWMY